MDYKPEEDLANYSYEPESDIDDDVPLAEAYPEAAPIIPEPVTVPVKVEAPIVSETVQEIKESVPIAHADEFQPNQKHSQPLPATEITQATENIVNDRAKPPIPGATPVEGFQLVQASGLTDTFTPSPRGSAIPEFATATPVPHVPLPHTATVDQQHLQPPMPYPPAISRTESNPLDENSKSKQFNARTDFMISEFFSRQVARLTMGAPGALERGYRVFQQRIKEKLGTQWAHVTSQPEVEEAIRKVQEMHDYFERLEKMVKKQKQTIERINDVETELSLFYKKEAISESSKDIRENMMYLANSYTMICKERDSLIMAYEHYALFLGTFKDKAIADALITMKRQHSARLELDAYGSKLGQMEEKKLKSIARSPGTAEMAILEKELARQRTQFQESKTKYQQLSTSLIDKSGLLDMKKGVDFAAHLAKVREVHDSFNRSRIGKIPAGPVPNEEDIDPYVLEH